MTDKPIPTCSFCHRDTDTVDVVIAGEGVAICADCVDVCVYVVRLHRAKELRREAMLFGCLDSGIA